MVYVGGNSTGTVPSGYKKSFFIPYRLSGKYEAKINGVLVMNDNNSSIFQVFEINEGDTFMTGGSTGSRCSLLIQFK